MGKFGKILFEVLVPDKQKIQARLNLWLSLYPRQTKGWSVRVSDSGSVKGSDQVLGYTWIDRKLIEVGLVYKGKYVGDAEVIDTFLHELAHVMSQEPGHGFVFKTQYGLIKSKQSKLMQEISGGW